MSIPITKETVISSPARLRELIMDADPIFLKIGEYLSMRPDVLPVEYCYALTDISDDIPAEPWPTIQAMLEAAWGKMPESIFSNIEELPLVSHVIAQYHQATLPDDTRVTIKIKRQGLEVMYEQYKPAILLMIEGLVANHILRCTSAAAFAEDIGTWMIRQMDLSGEAINLGRLHELYTGSEVVYVPHVYKEWSGEQVIVTEYVERVPVSEYANDTRVARNLLTVCLDQIVKYRFITVNLHFNSIILMRDVRIGMVATGEHLVYEKPVAADMRRLLTCLYEAQYKEVADIILRYVKGDPRGAAELQKALQALAQPSSSKSRPHPTGPEYTVASELREFPVTEFSEFLYPLLDKYKVGISPSISKVLNMLSVSEMISLRMQNAPAPVQKMGQEYFFYQAIREWAMGLDPEKIKGWPDLFRTLPLWANELVSGLADKGTALFEQWNKFNDRQDAREKNQRLLILAVLSVSMALLLTLPALQHPVGVPVRIMLGGGLAGIYIYILLKLIK